MMVTYLLQQCEQPNAAAFPAVAFLLGVRGKLGAAGNKSK